MAKTGNMADPVQQKIQEYDEILEDLGKAVTKK
jgi:hypothetical protein